MKYLKKILDGIVFLLKETSCAVFGYLIGIGIALLLHHSGSNWAMLIAGIALIVCGISLFVFVEIHKYRKLK